MPPQTPISRTKTAALTRVLDVVPRGYTRHTAGIVKPEKAIALANKFHRLYAVGASPAKRLIHKRDGVANTLLVMYWPLEADIVHWLLLATAGLGLDSEQLHLVTEKPRLNWLGYELVRHATRGQTSWTWRRPKPEMAEHYAMLRYLAGRNPTSAMAGFLERLSHQPGFHGVREQTKSLFQSARGFGYAGDLPALHYVQKSSHGERFFLTG